MTPQQVIELVGLGLAAFGAITTGRKIAYIRAARRAKREAVKAASGKQ